MPAPASHIREDQEGPAICQDMGRSWAAAMSMVSMTSPLHSYMSPIKSRDDRPSCQWSRE